MRKQTNPVEGVPVDCQRCATVPISHLNLDLSAPMAGWKAMLATRGVEIVLDDVGRPAVPRAVVGELIAERDAAEAKRAEEYRRKLAEAPPRPVLRGIRPEAGSTATALEAMMGYDSA